MYTDNEHYEIIDKRKQRKKLYRKNNSEDVLVEETEDLSNISEKKMRRGQYYLKTKDVVFTEVIFTYLSIFKLCLETIFEL